MHRSLPSLIVLLTLLLIACSTGGGTENTPTPVADYATAQPQASPDEQPAAIPSEAATRTATGQTAVVPGEETTTASASSPTEVPQQVTVTRAAPQTEFDRIAADAAKIRGLGIREDIREDYLTREQLRERLSKQLDEEYKPADAMADERVLSAFGLIPEDLDLRELYLELYTEQIAGFYDTETENMYVISTGKRLNALGELTYAHEVTHALQDQHYDLDRLSKPYEDKNDDTLLAITALIEGDAVALQNEYLISKPALIGRIQDAFEEEQISSEKLGSAPPIISESLLFPYDAGARFVTALRQDGAWKNVDAAYKDPPKSTEQILHPEKYTDRDAPTAVTVPDLGAALGDDWAKLETNLFGEFQTRVLLEGQLDDAVAREAAEGWDGDGFVLWGKGEQNVVAWQTVWDAEGDAEQFIEALREYDEARFDASFEDVNGTLTLSADGRVATLRRDGASVSYALAPSVDMATLVMDALDR
ncbi:MAG: hypothetical protein M3506_02275 [Chloroflexota bacterium]|nr:hypothetical protein [Chloroflexota bacterium]